MDLIPAIDLIDGRAVRLVRGDFDDPIETTADPLELVRSWVAGGARRLHIVDLHGARSGRARESATIARLAATAHSMQAGVRIQAGGGLRDAAALEVLFESGVDDALLGSAALADPSFLAACAGRWPGRIGVALDLRRGRPAVDGWQRELALEPTALATRLVDAGASRLVVTDIERDGTGAGPNLGLMSSLRGQLPSAELIASGGVATAGQLRQLADVGVDGAIVGRALLEGSLGLAEALAACRTVEAPA